MIQGAFNGMIALMLAKFVLNGVPHAAGISGPTGTCYLDAWRYVIQHPEGMLVHGTAASISTGVSKCIGHAWVELPYGTVWEPYSKRILPIEDFYRFTDAIPQDRYTPEEAAIMLARAGKHGPWYEDERRQYINR